MSGTEGANEAYQGRKQEMTPERVAEIKRSVEAGERKAKVDKGMNISREPCIGIIEK